MRIIAALATAVVIVLATAGCAAPSSSGLDPAGDPPPGVEPASLALLLVNGQAPSGPTTTLAMPVGDVEDVPWAQYLEASKRVGLDFSAAEGRAATLYRTPVTASNPDAAAFVLVVDGRVAGAWLDPGGGSSGVVAINERR
ncbi:MAG TPA: DUF4830 domain-containing protein [Candidatus Limnocylindrales bacterium]|nr:DUF4830 domain-containing protein [Candidatus Limnocylindrales bacterium]